MADDRNRRGAPAVRLVLVVWALAAVLSLAFSGVASAATQNPIQAENSLPGTPGWDAFASIAQQDAISGFASKTSVNHGDSIDFFVTTTAASFQINVFRVGWYQGIGARLVQSLGTFPGVHQAIPAPNPVTGIVSCANWTKTTTLNVPSTWTSGVYLAKLTASNGNESFIIFVVRNDGGTEPVLFQTSVTTYQAYNAWGGVSLYTNNTNGSAYKYAHATKVSFDRPYDPQDGNGAGQFFAYEYPMIRWAESQGYNVSYITDVDTATNVNPITNHRVYLSVGHDEYWSHSMRNNVTNAIALGVNAAFFSANSAYWQIRFEANSLGAANRVEVGYKDIATFNAPPGPDPAWGIDNPDVTTRWRDDPVNLPENSFIGVMYQDQVNRDYSYVVQNASNWIYAGSGFTNGTSVPGIVGYEYDKVTNNGFSPANETVLSNSPVVGCCEGSGNSFSNSTLYTAPNGAQVFASGTIQWSWGLDNYSSDGNFANAGIQKTTANILNKFSAGSSAPGPAVTLSPTSLSFPNQTTGTASGAKTVTLTNTGTAALTINSVGITGTNSGDFSQTSNCPVSPSTLAANGSCAISVTFAPTAPASRTASLSISDNAPGTPQTVGLSGTGVAPAPAVTLSPTSLGFGPQSLGTTSSPQTATLTNSGSGAMTITGIGITGTNVGDFAQTSTCPISPSTLGPNASCTVSVTFSPAGGGSRTASVSITDDAAGSPQSIALSGTGNAPAVTLSPTSLSFASQTVGSTSAAQSITLTNSGTAALTLSSVAIAGTNAGDFAQTSTCPVSPSTLAPNASCTIAVTFTPGATGSRSASVALTDSAPDSPQSAALSGTGAAPAPAVTLTPGSIAFGTQQVGTTSPNQTSTVQNSGSAPLTIGAISTAGTNAGDYSESDTCPVSPATLAVNATCTITVKFSPSGTGSRTASVTISDNAPGNPHSLALGGTGTAPAVTLTPSSLSFGAQKVGATSPAQTVTVKNSGTAPLSLTGITLSGTNATEYAQTNTCPASPSTLAVNATCTVSVTFSPAAAGSRTATLNIADNAPGSPQPVALSGTGSTSSIAFDKTLGKYTQNVGTTTIPLTSTAAAVAGSRVFAFVNWNAASGTLASVSGGGLTWTVDAQAKDASNNHGAIASASAPTGLPSGTKITATFSANVANGLVAAASFTGIAATAPVDVTASSLQAGVAAWTGSVATTNASDLVLGWSGIDANTTNTAAAPNVKIYDFGDANLWEWSTAEYRIESTTGTKTVNGTWANASGSSANVTVLAAYKGS